MIDWVNLLAHSCWILGCAILLATVSQLHWQIRLGEMNWRRALAEAPQRHIVWFALTLVGIGLAGTSPRRWEQLLWIIFVIIALLQWQHLWRHRFAQDIGSHGN